MITISIYFNSASLSLCGLNFQMNANTKSNPIFFRIGFCLCMLIALLVPGKAFTLLPGHGYFYGQYKNIVFGTGHVIAFCVFTILLYTWNWINNIYSALIWLLLIPVVVECCQIFSPGRNPGLDDLGLNMLGTLLGLVLVRLSVNQGSNSRGLAAPSNILRQRRWSWTGRAIILNRWGAEAQS